MKSITGQDRFWLTTVKATAAAASTAAASNAAEPVHAYKQCKWTQWMLMLLRALNGI